MTPVRLCLSNFMSYPAGAPVIDFTGFRVACITGENGNGKSALLDAMTWSLWGQARAQVDSLVRTNQELMWVDFEFDVDDTRYRVIRKRTRTGNGSTHTDLQVVTEDGTYRSQSGTGERATQEKINRLLRMDYKTFISSAFILQGRSDEFTRSTASDRKQILAEILDLERYEQLEIRAKGRHDLSKDRAQRLEGEIQGLATEIARKGQYQDELAAAQSSLTERQALLKDLEAQMGLLRLEMSRLEAQAALFENLKAQEQQVRADALESRRRADGLQQRLTVLDDRLKQRPTIQKRLAEWNDARSLLETMEEARNRFQDAQAEETKVEARLTALRHSLELRVGKLEGQIRELKRQASSASRLQAEIPKARQSSPPPAELDRQMDGLRAENEKIIARIQSGKSGIESLEKQIADLLQRRGLLDAPSAACPVCRRSLETHDHKRLLEELEADRVQLHERREAFSKECSEAEQKQREIRRRGNETKAKLEQARLVEQQIIRLESELQTAQAAANHASTVEQELHTLKQEQSGPLDADLQKRLDELKRIKDAAGYDRKQHEALKERARGLQAAEREAQDLEHAAQSRLEMLQMLKDTTERAARQENHATSLADQLAPLAGVPGQMAELSAQVQGCTLQRERLARESATAQEGVGRWTTLLEQCRGKEEQEQKARQDLAAASKDSAIYKELAAAFSKRGIQAMIIENVIPELEDEANRLLSQMTDNGMHIQFRTQRELKKGGGAETLDIVIGDEMGDRPYECYSGGEAFRINFAIRIALSRLLARRAGARLQTIVIDEGFGTQDAQGRKRLVEAIQSVKEEFTRILVITHLDDLKDEFPTRLYVSKDQNGSRVTVMT